MRPSSLALLALSLGLSACGGSPATTLLVSCNGTTALAGATSVDVVVDPVAKSTMLRFPDPVNTGHTGTIPVTARCTISPKS